jgi:hypothetical protein
MSPKRAKSVPEQTSKCAPEKQWAVEELLGEKKVAMKYIRE